MSEHRPHPDPTEAPLEPLYTHPASPFVQTDTSAPAHVEMRALPAVQSTWSTYRTQIEFGLAMLAYLMVLVGSITVLQANPKAAARSRRMGHRGRSTPWQPACRNRRG